jgi:hypothetical protein
MNTGYNFIKFKDPRLGRFIPPDFQHVEKYPLKAAPPKPVPVCAGINWYSDFDNPVKGTDGKYWVGKNKNKLGSIRGGHCICIPDDTKNDLQSWYIYYNQLAEGKCVGEGACRMMSLENRVKYDPTWLWNEAKVIDEWPETNPGDDEGTSVRAAMDILRLKGPLRNKAKLPKIEDGISANRWATKIDDLFSVLQNDTYKKKAAMPFLNSWGEDYPHIVWMPAETWERLLAEDGEFTMITDK